MIEPLYYFGTVGTDKQFHIDRIGTKVHRATILRQAQYRADQTERIQFVQSSHGGGVIRPEAVITPRQWGRGGR